ncbi:MAG: substrate-binding domain-containing protein [Verrucomicrobiae bacterium]|nr:substrate-binding domain-containing protein [Verrucomicrobiae bacterium]
MKAGEDKATIGILIGANLLDEDAAFYRTLVQMIKTELGQQNYRSRVYDRVYARDPKEAETVEDYQYLLWDIQNQAYKGLIGLGIYSTLLSRELSLSNLPRALFGSTTGDGLVDIDLYGFVQSAVEYLAGQGCRRIIYLRSHHIVPQFNADLDGFLDAVQRMKVPNKQVMEIAGLNTSRNQSAQLGYQQTMKMLGSLSLTESTPVGLIVADDIIMKGVDMALKERKTRVPQQLVVACMTNEGIQHPYHNPVARFEVPLQEVSRKIVETVVNHGGAPQSMATIMFKANHSDRKEQDRGAFAPMVYRAFTLIELLVVICLISMLCSLIFPALRTAREHGRQVVCMSNLHQISIAMLEYLSENNEIFPATVVWGDWDDMCWIGLVRPYWNTSVKASNAYLTGYSVDKVLRCPSDNRSRLIYAYDSSYGLNVWINSKTLFSMSKPAEVLMFGDYGTTSSINYSWNPARLMNGATYTTASPRHYPTFNACFCDGHIMVIPYSVVDLGLGQPKTPPWLPQ